MFMQFLQAQASVLASQAPNIKWKGNPNPETLTGKESSVEQINESLKIFRISLNFMITLNLDRMPTPEARIAYNFSSISGTA